MKLITSILFIILSFNLKAYDIIGLDSIECILDTIHKEQLFEDYYNKLKDVETWFLENGLDDRITANKIYYQKLPCNFSDSLLYRKALMYYANLVQKVTGDIHVAMPYYYKAHNMGEPIGFNDEWSWYIENKIGNNLARIGDFDKAIYFYLLCLETESGEKRKGRLFKNLASCYYWLGDIDNSLFHLDNAVENSRLIGDYKGLTSSYEQYASICLDANKYSDFLNYYNQSRISVKSLTDYQDTTHRSAKLDALFGEYNIQHQQYSEAILSYRSAIKKYRTIFKGIKSRDIAKLYHQLATAFLLSKDFISCKTSIDTAFNYLLEKEDEIPKYTDLYLENTFVDILDLFGQYYFKRNEFKNQPDIDSAIACADLALKINNDISRVLISEKSKYVTVSERQDVINNHINYTYYGYMEYPDNIDKYRQKLIELFTTSKGIVKMQSRNRKLIKDGFSENVKFQIDIIEDELLSNINNPDNGQYQIRKLIQLDSIYSSSQIKKLDSKLLSTPFVEYFIADDRVFLLTNIEGVRILELDITSSELENSIFRILNSLESKDLDYENYLVDISPRLFPINISNLSNIKIIPDKWLNLFPFDIVQQEDKYLIELVSISYGFTNLVNTNEAFNYSSVNAFGFFPDYNSVVDANVIRSLHYVQEEKRLFKKIFGSNSIVIENSDAISLNKQLKNVDIFHFAGHSIVDDTNPYLVSTNFDGTLGFIYSTEIEHFNQELEIVSLTSCQTGTGQILFGEGLRSLASSFLSFGSKSVLYSLWNLNDKSASKLVTNFYSNLTSGQHKDNALRKAKLDFFYSSDPISRHPYYWAGIAIVGEVRPLYEESYQGFPFSLVILGVFILIICKLLKQ